MQACLALELCPTFGLEPMPQVKENAGDAYAKLCKRYINYFESDLTFLPGGDAWGNAWTSGPWN